MKFLMTSTFFPPYHLGGDSIHVEYLTSELMKMGHEVHIFHSLDAYFVKKRQFPNKGKSNDVFIHALKTRLCTSPYSAYALGNSTSAIKRFETLVSALKPDVVHHHNISLLGYAVLRKRGDYKNLYTAHDFWLNCQLNFSRTGSICNHSLCPLCAVKHGKPPQLWRYRKGFKTAVRCIDLLIAPSEYLRRRLCQSINVKSMTMANFAPLPPRDIPESPYADYFLFVGRLEEYKGIMNLLEAFARVRKRTASRLLIVGEGSLKGKIERFIRGNSLNGSVLCEGSARGSKLYSLYKNAHALIVPSISPENSPLVALEALSVGTPVIASNLGGQAEIVSKVDKKLLFNDLEELEYILTHFSECNIDAGRIKEIYDMNFSPTVYIDRYLKAIRNI